MGRSLIATCGSDSVGRSARGDNGAVRVPSSDHVNLAVHEFGGDGPPLLLSHATGFHGYAYLPIADALDHRFTSYAVDYRGHGDTPRTGEDADEAAAHEHGVDWTGYGDDALAAARFAAPNGGLTGFGHSMGGTALLMAAHRDPDLFDTIVVFEPIVFDPDADRPSGEPQSPQVVGARRRRPSFDSFEAAIDNYRSKLPMSAFDPEVVRLYVAHGFRSAPEGIRLKCDREHEARTFENGGRHRTWDLLPDISTRVVVATGIVEDSGPSAVARQIADRLPNSIYVEIPTLDHFGPFVDPAQMAALIAEAVDTG